MCVSAGLGRATQDGVFECAEGVPWTCDAECAIEFGPYWETCMLQSGLGGTGDMEGFATLYDTCKNLPPGENAVLMHTVNDIINDPWCRINTTGIISVSTLALTAFTIEALLTKKPRFWCCRSIKRMRRARKTSRPTARGRSRAVYIRARWTTARRALRRMRATTRAACRVSARQEGQRWEHPRDRKCRLARRTRPACVRDRLRRACSAAAPTIA
eukprot:COSAG06_NODE_244_length_19215_cov_20.256853_16_plen_215_part_00